MRRTSAFLLLALLGCSRQETRHANTVAAPNAPVILISIDTLRADHLPAYGYNGVATPALDAFRKDAILFTNAYSHVPLTLPAHVSMLTGLLPPDHGVRNNIGFPFDAKKHPTIPSLLKSRGYATGAAISAYVLRGHTGLRDSFDVYADDIAVRDAEAIGRLQRPGSEAVADIQRFIVEHRGRPFFAMLHLFEPHTPYAPPEPFLSRYTNRYDGEIAATDHLLGEFFAVMKQLGVYDRALIIVTADHGEGLGQHGEDEHGIFVYREAIHVPLFVKLPSSQRANTTVDQPVQHIDILPTVLEVCGAPPFAAAKGRSLLAVTAARRVYSESLYPRIHLGWSELRSLVDDKFHFIDAPRPELYAKADPAERVNVAEDNRRVVSSMRRDLEPFGRDIPTVGSIDPEDAKKLAALGYLSSSSADTGGPLPDPKDHIEELAMMKEGARLELAGRSAEAISKYRAVLDRNPRLTDAWTMLGRQLERTGEYEQAIQTYKRGIQVAPAVAGELSLSLANVYLILNKPAEAASHAQLGIGTNPGNAHIILGRAALATDDLVTAKEQATLALQSPSYRPAAMVLIAQVLTKKRQLEEALTMIDRATREAETQRLDAPALLYFVRGDILARLNRADEAVAAFNEEIRLYPRNQLAYANLAVVYLLTGRPRQANETMERLVRANPNRGAYELAARTFAELGDNRSAAAWRARR